MSKQNDIILLESFNRRNPKAFSIVYRMIYRRHPTFRIPECSGRRRYTRHLHRYVAPGIRPILVNPLYQDILLYRLEKCLQE